MYNKSTIEKHKLKTQIQSDNFFNIPTAMRMYFAYFIPVNFNL